MKERIDRLAVERGLAPTRERARAMIMEGKVFVAGHPVTKPGSMVEAGADISLKGGDIPFVGRGGLKLDAALSHFGIDVRGMVAMDVGASTGGFTDCLLQRGASKVYAIDVGYGQFDWKLRQDKRVVLMERTNIRALGHDTIAERPDIAVIDVSFISLAKVLPCVAPFLSPAGVIIALVKPQFEAGRSEVGKGGIVKSGEVRLRAVKDVETAAEALGFSSGGFIESPIKGQKGNVEYLIYLKQAKTG